MKYRLLLLIFFMSSLMFSSKDVFAQSFIKKYINSIINDKSEISKAQLLVYPTFAYAPETTWEIGLNSLYVYYAKQDTNNRLSELNGFTFFTLEKQYGLWLDHSLYADKDNWFFLGKLRFQSFPLLYHGIGINTPKEYIAKVDANQIIIKERVLKKLRKNLFLGLEVDYQSLSAVSFELDKPSTTFQYPLGDKGFSNLGLGIGLALDNRHNVLNVRKGFFSELAILHSNPSWGSDFKFTTITSDNRFYKPVGKNNVLATQVFGQFNFGDVPFNQLSLMGGENMMKGYYYGRYRDNNQLVAQAEYRLLPIPLSFTNNRIGAAVFAGTGTVFSQSNNLRIADFKVSAGAGLRYLLFPKKDIWTRLDYALTNEGSGFYFFIGESF
jgi:hypothetical protein